MIFRFSNPFYILAVLVVVLGLGMVFSLGIGSVDIPAHRVIGLLIDQGESGDPVDETSALILADIRLPRVLLAALVGAALALSGTVMQGFFQNPMADPYIIGISSGAGLGAALAMGIGLDFWFFGLSGIGLLAFAGALAVTLMVYGISLRGGRLPPTVVLLSGIALGAVAGALTSLVMIVANDGADVQRILFWLMGSLASRRWEHVHMVWPQIAFGALFLQYYARDLDMIIQGEEQAQYLGVDVERVKRLLLVGATLLAAGAVSVSGIIGFVGLIVPHVMRLLVGPTHRILLPSAMLGGAILLVGADLLARIVVAPGELPIGIITSLLGAPFFLFLLRRRVAGW